MRIVPAAAVPLAALVLAGCSGASGGSGAPTATASGAIPTASSPAATSEADYCAIVNAGTAFDSDVGTMADDLQALVADPATLGDPATLSAVHAKGEELLSASVGTAAYFNQIAAAVNDPGVAAAYSGTADWIVALYQAEGQAAVDAGTPGDLVSRLASISGSAEVTGLQAQRPGWSQLIGDYFKANCA